MYLGICHCLMVKNEKPGTQELGGQGGMCQTGYKSSWRDPGLLYCAVWLLSERCAHSVLTESFGQQSSKSQDRKSEGREKRDILSFDKIKEQRERERQRQREREIRETERRR